MNFSTLINPLHRLVGNNCCVNFKDMILHQDLNDLRETLTYNIVRCSTKSNFKKKEDFSLIEYLTKWNWYIKLNDGKYSCIDENEDIKNKLKISSNLLETNYHEFLKFKRKICLNTEPIKIEVNFETMRLIVNNDTESCTEKYYLTRRPEFKLAKFLLYF